MKTILFVAVLVAAWTAPTWADENPPNSKVESAHCENSLSAEVLFEQVPNDLRNGMITDELELNVENLVEAYRRGIFPWSITPEGNARWHSPPVRGILDFCNLHISKSDRKFIQRHLNSGEFEITYDQAFDQVIEECARIKRFVFDAEKGYKVESAAWLVPEIIEAFKQLHRAGYAHSTEVWHKGELVGGLYGTHIDGFYTGESMFHHRPDVLKLALFSLIERLKAKGITFIDTQLTLGLIKKWNGETITREEFLARLRRQQDPNRTF
jgi:leucyl/phenylalanyl-tRNA--protein transferase